MALSGTKTFELDVAEYIEEAYERCGLEIRTGYDQRTARRSLNLLLAEWANRGLNQWTIERVTIPVNQNSASYELPNTVIDFLTVVVQLPNNGNSNANIDLTVDRISRDYYLNIPNKTTQGRPVQYTINRSITPVLYVWPTPDQEYDLIYSWSGVGQT